MSNNALRALEDLKLSNSDETSFWAKFFSALVLCNKSILTWGLPLEKKMKNINTCPKYYLNVSQLKTAFDRRTRCWSWARTRRRRWPTTSWSSRWSSTSTGLSSFSSNWITTSSPWEESRIRTGICLFFRWKLENLLSYLVIFWSDTCYLRISESC